MSIGMCWDVGQDVGRSEASENAEGQDPSSINPHLRIIRRPQPLPRTRVSLRRPPHRDHLLVRLLVLLDMLLVLRKLRKLLHMPRKLLLLLRRRRHILHPPRLRMMRIPIHTHTHPHVHHPHRLRPRPTHIRRRPRRWRRIRHIVPLRGRRRRRRGRGVNRRRARILLLLLLLLLLLRVVHRRGSAPRRRGRVVARAEPPLVPAHPVVWAAAILHRVVVLLGLRRGRRGLLLGLLLLLLGRKRGRDVRVVRRSHRRRLGHRHPARGRRLNDLRRRGSRHRRRRRGRRPRLSCRRRRGSRCGRRSRSRRRRPVRSRVRRGHRHGHGHGSSPLSPWGRLARHMAHAQGRRALVLVLVLVLIPILALLLPVLLPRLLLRLGPPGLGAIVLAVCVCVLRASRPLRPRRAHLPFRAASALRFITSTIRTASLLPPPPFAPPPARAAPSTPNLLPPISRKISSAHTTLFMPSAATMLIGSWTTACAHTTAASNTVLPKS
ncbi:hypothetical protein L227DRAFT_53595 [Lentinus tigrinus ALCF2SS1-6]|uniref:Uncharacterized protein n=1 Tax=Lentinus tigrinus ALCF2SS1-6 TaxID=1328759 RepID=A0A5C2SE75_9APHY|nr:hypothetical protein L227DRAFT_53595 [Lentinus tigrinus ALCF2SS1-6]